MKVLRKGDRCEDVKVLQKALHLVQDGIFGVITDEAVRAFQRNAGLFPDGIVGPKTWALLSADADISITKAVINTHVTYSPNRQVKYIAIHYTAGSTSRSGAAMNTRKVFLSRPASADFVVDDNEIVQINPDIRNYYCWAVGDKRNPYTNGGRLSAIAMNKNTVSIEICSNLKIGMSSAYPNHEGWYFTEASLQKAVELVRYLMKRYGVPKSNIIRHYDVTGKLCPGLVGWNDALVYDDKGNATGKKNNSNEWEIFLKRL